VTAEPRMEDLLASIRKAINEDIGPESASQHGGKPAAARAPEDASPTSSEIQQLREKITRSRTGEPPAPRDPAQRAASLAAALRSSTPRRAWRDIEPMVQAQQPQPQPAQPAPRFRSTIVEPESPRTPARTEEVPRPAPRFAPPRQPSAWPHEDSSPAVPREVEHAPKSDQPPILSGAPAQAVQSAFNRLAETVLARAIGEQSIEEMTQELLKAMLKQWLDENLPDMVERLVREEIERVARTGR
jgi:cell pole-organizing protein PopZ